MKKILLIGNPNVGKSAIFTHLTGVSVITSNYPGTTIDLKKGYLTFHSITPAGCNSCKQKGKCTSYDAKKAETIEVIDVPGTYRLDPECDAEKVASDMVSEGDILVNLIDATNLERNLNLTLQLLEYDKPVIVVLNMWDETKHKGITINIKKLEEALGVPVVTTSGLTGVGVDKLISTIAKVKDEKRAGKHFNHRWEIIGNIIENTQKLEHRHHTFFERLQDLSVHPIAGIPLAVLSLFLIFQIIIGIGEFLVGVMEKFFEFAYTPVIHFLHGILSEYTIIHYILLGNIGDVAIEYETAMGVLTTGVFMVFGLVLPYILVFYLVLGFLEDLGYLARIAVLFDRFLHAIGLHGFSIIPMMLSFGCNVPGILAVRNLETRREKFITAIVTSITIPCIAQSAIIFRILGSKGFIYVASVYIILVCIWLVLGTTMKFFVKGNTTTLIMEIPPYRKPGFKMQIKTIIMRLKGFLIEAVPYVLGGILFINILQITGIIDFIGNIFKPVVKGAFGLPKETVSTLIIGIVRKDAAVALLEPFALSNYQLVTAVTVLIIYFPCIATFIVLAKELKLIDTIKATGIMAVVTLITGFVINKLYGTIFMPVVFLIILISFSILYAIIMTALKEKIIKKRFQN